MGNIEDKRKKRGKSIPGRTEESFVVLAYRREFVIVGAFAPGKEGGKNKPEDGTNEKTNHQSYHWVLLYSVWRLTTCSATFFEILKTIQYDVKNKMRYYLN